MDVKNELETMKNFKGGDYFKPKRGTQKIVIIGEPVEDTWINPDGESQPQVVFDIEVAKKPYKWSVPKGKTLSSLWGQLALASKVQGYKFNGLLVTLVVVGDGKDRRYTVLEAADLIEEEEVIQ